MYSIQEVCEKTGLTAHTLRYYEKEGLLTGVARSTGGFRQYSDEDMEWLGLFCCLFRFFRNVTGLISCGIVVIIPCCWIFFRSGSGVRRSIALVISRALFRRYSGTHRRC